MHKMDSKLIKKKIKREKLIKNLLFSNKWLLSFLNLLLGEVVS